MKNRQKAVALLEEFSTPEERSQLRQSEEARKRVTDIIDQIKPLQEEIEKPKNEDPYAQIRIMKRMIEVMSAGFEGLVSKMDEVKQTSIESRQNDFAPTMQSVAKLLSDGLGAVKKSVDDKPQPVWRFPQYLYSGLRDTQFKPINPAIDSFGIGDFDQTVLSYTGSNLTGVVYKLATRTVATLTLTYDGSDNLINVVKS